MRWVINFATLDGISRDMVWSVVVYTSIVRVCLIIIINSRVWKAP